MRRWQHEDEGAAARLARRARGAVVSGSPHPVLVVQAPRCCVLAQVPDPAILETDDGAPLERGRLPVPGAGEAPLHGGTVIANEQGHDLPTIDGVTCFAEPGVHPLPDMLDASVDGAIALHADAVRGERAEDLR